MDNTSGNPVGHVATRVCVNGTNPASGGARRNPLEEAAVAESFDLGALVEEFRDEARDQVDRLDGGLIQLEREGGLSEEPRSELLRALHTLKGNAGMLGLSAIRDFVHVLENVLKSPPDAWADPMLERLFEGAAAVRRAVEAAGTDDQTEAFGELTAARHRVEELEPPGRPTSVVAGGSGAGAEAEGGGGAPLDRVRVPFQKLDALLSEVGELAAELAGVEEALQSVGVSRSVRASVQAVRRRARGIRDGVMGLRLVPMARVLARFHALVRRLAREQGKEARLVVEGEGTEVDKSTADALSEPLLHLVRNAIDHGIQTPAEREAVGKPRHGTIRVIASQDGDGVRLVVEDDGSGLDLPAIRSRAEAAGLVQPGATRTAEEIAGLIFLPGFSTRTDVSTVSGRGVGLDVVRRSIRELRGDLRVERLQEGGTRFVMRLPLTVAVVPSLILETGGEVLAVAAADVVRTLKLMAVERVGAGEMVRVDGKLVPVIVPGRLFGWKEDGRGSLGVLVRSGADAAVLAADRFLDQRDLVVKQLPPFGSRPLGVSAASLRPGGRVILVLDALEVMQLNEERPGGSAAA